MERAGDEHDLGAWSSRDAVEAWQRSSAARNATLAAATERMLDLAALRPGARVLDLGTGTGDQAFAAAARVGPQGHVLATDISAEMVAEAAAGAARAGLGNVATRVLDVARDRPRARSVGRRHLAPRTDVHAATSPPPSPARAACCAPAGASP